MARKYPAQVINNNDPDQEGKVQVYCEPLHHGFKASEYPWAKQDREWTSNIPETGDIIWIWFEDEIHWRKPFYGNKVNLKDLHEHNETMGQITGTYPNVKYIKLKNSCSIAMNSDSPEITIYHPSAEIYINEDGDILMNSNSMKNKIEMTDDSIEIDHDDGTSIIKLESDQIEINHNDKSKITMDMTDVKIENVTGETITLDVMGVTIEDKLMNKVELAATGITAQNAAGTGKIEITVAGGITLTTPDSSNWHPCGLQFCVLAPIIPHGGTAIGITQLKGG